MAAPCMTNKCIIRLIEERNGIICKNKKMEHALNLMDCDITCLKEKINNIQNKIDMLRKTVAQCNHGEELNSKENVIKTLQLKLRRMESENQRLNRANEQVKQEVEFSKEKDATKLNCLVQCLHALQADVGDAVYKVNERKTAMKRLGLKNATLKTHLREMNCLLERKNHELDNLANKIKMTHRTLVLQDSYKIELLRYEADLKSEMILYESLVQAENSFLDKYLEKIYQIKGRSMELDHKLPKKIDRYEREFEKLKERRDYFLKDIMEKINEAKTEEPCPEPKELGTLVHKKATIFKSDTMNDTASDQEKPCEQSVCSRSMYDTIKEVEEKYNYNAECSGKSPNILLSKSSSRHKSSYHRKSKNFHPMRSKSMRNEGSCFSLVEKLDEDKIPNQDLGTSKCMVYGVNNAFSTPRIRSAIRERTEREDRRSKFEDTAAHNDSSVSDSESLLNEEVETKFEGKKKKGWIKLKTIFSGNANKKRRS